MKQWTGFVLALLAGLSSRAQIDTINTGNNRLNTAAFKEGKSAYAVYFEDSTGKRITSADIWDRTIKLTTTADGQKHYQFGWQWYRKDTLIADVTATGLFPSFQPLTHEAVYTGRGTRSFVFAGNVVTVPQAKRATAKDSTFRVVTDQPAFEFPMDLELFALLPFKKTGQQFAMAFYEPGGAQSAYYPLTVTGNEELPLPGGRKASCWLLRIDYAPGSYSTFWISDKTREVLKMKEYFRGRYRYKVKLY